MMNLFSTILGGMGGEGYFTRQVHCRGGPLFLCTVLVNSSGSSLTFAA
jgi:hypothetical protein